MNEARQAKKCHADPDQLTPVLSSGRHGVYVGWFSLTVIPLLVFATLSGPKLNIQPCVHAALLDEEVSGATAKQMHWGLIPSWAKDEKLAYRTINARVETASTKPLFRAAWKKRRGLIPSSGYYEWLKEGSTKQPYFIHATDAPVVFFAGLWEKRGELLTYSIVTREADPSIAFLHDRMPLMLPSNMLSYWIHGTADQAGQIALAAPEPDLSWHKVDRAVGNVRNHGEHLIDQISS